MAQYRAYGIKSNDRSGLQWVFVIDGTVQSLIAVRFVAFDTTIMYLDFSGQEIFRMATRRACGEPSACRCVNIEGNLHYVLSSSLLLKLENCWILSIGIIYRLSRNEGRK